MANATKVTMRALFSYDDKELRKVHDSLFIRATRNICIGSLVHLNSLGISNSTDDFYPSATSPIIMALTSSRGDAN